MGRKSLIVGTWLYLAAVLVVWLVVRVAGDRWWLATLMLFGPTWICGMPLAILVPAAAVIRRRLLWPLSAAAVVVLVPVMGFSIPWLGTAYAAGTTVGVLSCNLKGQCNNNPRLDELIAKESPDVVAFQGCWRELAVAWPKEWHVRQEGEFVVGSRYPLSESRLVHVEGEGGHRSQAVLFDCLVRIRGQDLHMVSVHLPSPHQGLSALD